MNARVLVLAVSGLMLLPLQARAGLKDSWDYYQGQVRRGSSSEERAQLLEQILSNPAYAKKDLTSVKSELHKVQTDVAFAESMDYFEKRASAGLPPDEQLAMLEHIIQKYESRGMDMSALKARAEGLRPPPVEEPAPAPAPEPAPAPPAPEPAEGDLAPWSVSLMGGFHNYPNETFFQANEDLFDVNLLDSPAGAASLDRHFGRISLGLEAGGYGGTAHYSIVNGLAALVGQTRVETYYARLAPRYHFSPGGRFEWALGGGLGAYAWKRNTHIVVNNVPATVINDVVNGTVFGWNVSGRFTWNVTRLYGVFVDYSYAIAEENDKEKTNAAGDTLNVGGQLWGFGTQLRW